MCLKFGERFSYDITLCERCPPYLLAIVQDLDAIDALVEAGVRNTRSDAAAWLIHAGIEANKALLEKVYGTVAEIRRLRIMAQSLAQEGTEQEAP